jgi:hypothetical protein
MSKSNRKNKLTQAQKAAKHLATQAKMQANKAAKPQSTQAKMQANKAAKPQSTHTPLKEHKMQNLPTNKNTITFKTTFFAPDGEYPLLPDGRKNPNKKTKLVGDLKTLNLDYFKQSFRFVDLFDENEEFSAVGSITEVANCEIWEKNWSNLKVRLKVNHRALDASDDWLEVQDVYVDENGIIKFFKLDTGPMKLIATVVQTPPPVQANPKAQGQSSGAQSGTITRTPHHNSGCYGSNYGVRIDRGNGWEEFANWPTASNATNVAMGSLRGLIGNVRSSGKYAGWKVERMN